MEMNGGAERHFELEGGDVWVTVPAQDSGGALEIQQITELPPGMRGTPTVFEPCDIRINFQVLKGGSPVQKFSPPMVLRVAITDQARARAADTGRLRLAYWDGSEWVLFTKRKHLFHLTPEYGIAVIRDWGDPAVAWG
jgi:hypothetical protein